MLPTIDAYHVHHLPMVKADADKIGWVEAINQLVPTERAIAPGTIVLGRILETRSGRRPLDRVEECLAQQDTALLLGKAGAPEAFPDDPVGRVWARLDDTGTMQVVTAGAVQADRVVGFDKRDLHVDPTSITLYGEYRPPEEAEAQEVPGRITSGSSKDKRPARKPCVLSTRWVDRAVPRWGTPADGHAAAPTVNPTVGAAIATFLAPHGVAPGAYIDVADAARVTEEHRGAWGDPWCMSRVPAPAHAWGRLIADAVAHDPWAEVGVLASTKPTTHRPVTS